jgi:hypothetical protein
VNANKICPAPFSLLFFVKFKTS